MLSIAFLLVLFIAGIVASATIYLLYQVLINFHPGKNRVLNDLRKMESEIKPWISDLIPWKMEEVDLLSINQINRAYKKGIATTMKGVFTSIYQEPMVVYSYRRYFSEAEDALLYARTSHREFIYRIRKGEVNITIDDQNIGTLRADGKLYQATNAQLLAEIKRDSDELVLPIWVKNREIAGLAKPQGAMNVNARAFEFVSDMAKGEEAILLSLSILELVKNDLPVK